METEDCAEGYLACPTCGDEVQQRDSDEAMYYCSACDREWAGDKVDCFEAE